MGREVGMRVPGSAGEARARATIVRNVPGRLDEDWLGLVAAASEPNPFAEPWFVQAGLRHLGGGKAIRLIEARDDAGRLDALMPVTIGHQYGRIPIAHTVNWLHHHSFLGTPLIRAGRERAAWTSMLRLLDEAGWAPAFLHLTKLVEDGPVHRSLASACDDLGRACDIVYREERALLQSGLGVEAYLDRTIRKKKRKELRRLANRLAEQGELRARGLDVGDDAALWCEDFLTLEQSGWKGEVGSALANRPETAAFFREAALGAHAAGRLDIRRLDLDGRAIAMMINFMTPPGGFSFKIAYDEAFAHFSPGVLVQLDNLAAVLGRPDIAWMDSCAAPHHPMIDSLWGERRSLIRVTVPLAGVRRAAAFHSCRMLERASAAARSLRPAPLPRNH